MALHRRSSSGSTPPRHAVCLQLARQVEHALRPGYLKPGDQLPNIRDVVASLAINPNTVLGAGLDEDGIVALFASALRDFYELRSAQADRGPAGGETKGVA